ncbi:MAG: hypothetical protein ACR2IB_09855 [Pyrinomonadaceae bacterium]
MLWAVAADGAAIPLQQSRPDFKSTLDRNGWFRSNQHHCGYRIDQPARYSGPGTNPSRPFDRQITVNLAGLQDGRRGALSTAVHEAGHVAVGLDAKHGDPIHKVSILPSGQALGFTQSLPERDRLMKNASTWKIKLQRFWEDTLRSKSFSPP